ncbi:hypothetical protein C5708_18315 [Caulobacter sp. CCUG 60055]|nr:hypothetical protein [Caulobacter sp. CCUG 60055]MCI3182202.1 hypothetical protein [Caulobacter sp. CCUG 60055]
MRGRRLSKWISGAVALFGAALPAAAAPPAQPPQAWMAYATQATSVIAGWMNEDDARAARVRDVLASAGGEAERDGHVEVRIWIAPDGVITQAAAPAAGAAEVQASLRALLEGRRLAAPPKRMTQPLRIGLQAGPAPAPSEPPKAAATR